jgi:flavin reductase (DIM6/NTAB) family NADH-FMN oxidoreductase RutF
MKDNPFQIVGGDWMLVTAGSPDAYNTMTASWGGFGVIWAKNIAWCAIRPSRHTYNFIEKADNFTLSFFDKEYHSALEICGSKSGRDIDKAAATGLTPIAASAPDTTTFAQARMVVECKKIYFQDLVPAHFLDESIEGNYKGSDYHRMYMGEITNILVR